MKIKSIALKTIPVVVLVLLIKLFVHQQGWELMELNALFTSIIAANVFLLGFLLVGVLSDYKESEKLPGELAVSLEAIFDEGDMLYRTKQIPAAKKCQDAIQSLLQCLQLWFHKTERTKAVFSHISDLSAIFVQLEPHTPANYIVRLKQEQSNIRRIVTRIDAIRDTSFITSGYRIVEINSVALIVGLIALKLEPFSNALFLAGTISYLFTYMLFLIKDLDNPFGFHTQNSFENVSIKAITDLVARLKNFE